MPFASPQRLLDWADRRRAWLLGGVLILYLLGFNGQWRVERDSALYLVIGRNLAEGRGYTFQAAPQRLAFPGLPLLFAGNFKLFDHWAVPADLVAMLIMGFAALGLTYRLFLIHSGRPTAVVMTVGVAGTRLFYRYCFELLSDMPFLLGVMAFFVGYEAIFHRRKASLSRDGDGEPAGRVGGGFDWFLLIAGFVVAVSTRPAMWALLLAILLTTGWSIIRGVTHGIDWKRQLLFGAAILIATGFFLSIDPRRGGGNAVPEYEDTFFQATFSNIGHTLHEMVFRNIPELCGTSSALVKAFFGCPILPGVNTLCSFIIIFLSFALFRYRVLWGMWALLTLGMLLFFKPLDRYMLPVIPFLVYAWWRFMLWVHRSAPAKWADALFLGLLAFGIFTNMARLSQMVVEQRRWPFLLHYHEGRYVSVYKVANLIRSHTREQDWILVAPMEGRVIAFLAHRNTIKPSNQTAGDPRLNAEYALIGPNWEDAGRARDEHDESVAGWIQTHGYVLGPRLGPIVKSPREDVGWELHRVEKK
ncbi:MAG TPA: hypothetical protein VG326_13270 [Tepidisphaeraceae bacterium]|nr:hypothetical protein [Tepidisphaeraceae bacterium]